jgi:hypothetical protein
MMSECTKGYLHITRHVGASCFYLALPVYNKSVRLFIERSPIAQVISHNHVLMSAGACGLKPPNVGVAYSGYVKTVLAK